ncbi:glycosyl transferase family 2 [Kaistella solincola]|uniref:Glycosyl transferase family 2 n=1 Tax=Kaistella solincola TaxID=510955 RepID=A0ABR4ZTS3_9FLAO|nr:glycosyltransferase [Kaistella solincola]KIA85051.1 glycosyl transferase family 2 [Kaistella solincola]
MNPLVSIIIPVYNCEDFLERCLESIRNQTYPEIEVLLVNDKSLDKSGEIAENYIEKYQLKNWKIIHLEENLGSSVARNIGIDRTTGKYIFFVDSDDTITPDCIETLVEISEKTGAEMTISQLECEKATTGEKSICIKIKTSYELLTDNAKIFEEFAAGNLVTYPVNKLIKTEFLKENNLYFKPGIYAQDELWTFQCMLKMSTIAIHHGITYTYFLHDKSVIHNRKKKHFDDWFTIGKAVDEAFQKEKNYRRKEQILQYLTAYKSLTLLMNWRAQKDENLWKESYSNYKKLSKLSPKNYFSKDFTVQTKKADLFTRLPTEFGFRFFKWRYER